MAINKFARYPLFVVLFLTVNCENQRNQLISFNKRIDTVKSNFASIYISLERLFHFGIKIHYCILVLSRPFILKCVCRLFFFGFASS